MPDGLGRHKGISEISFHTRRISALATSKSNPVYTPITWPKGAEVGVAAFQLDLIIKLRQLGFIPKNARLVEIGAQQLADSALDVGVHQKLRDAFGHHSAEFGTIPPVATSEGQLTQDGELSPSAPYARVLWESLGFSHTAIDVDCSPGAIPLDLNFDQIPTAQHGQYDLVTNFGTTEHVANQLNAFKIIHDLTAKGGVMIHTVPTQGMMNHGLVNYNPKFFWMLARSNAYKWLYSNFSLAGEPYQLPQNIIDHVATFEPDIAQRTNNYQIKNGILTLALQKIVDIEFVAPLDGIVSKAPNRAFAERYWTVFMPDRLDAKLRQH